MHVPKESAIIPVNADVILPPSLDYLFVCQAVHGVNIQLSFFYRGAIREL